MCLLLMVEREDVMDSEAAGEAIRLKLFLLELGVVPLCNLRSQGNTRDKNAMSKKSTN